MRKSLINLLLLLASLILGLIFCELGVRIFGKFFPKVAFLSTIGKETPPFFANTLEEYIKTPEFLLHPHGRFIGCKTNSFGFYDEEFSQENTETIAIGDSYLFGRVAYPDNVITQLEGELSKRCDKKLPIANFGIAGLQPRDYLEVTRLALQKYKPKTILLHLYLGNDFPQLAELDQLTEEAPKKESLVSKYFTSQFRLFRLLDNLKRVLSADASQPEISSESHADAETLAGSCIPITNDEKKFLQKPSYKEDEWLKIVAVEAGRFYPGTEPIESRTKVKQRFIQPLVEIKKLCVEHGVRLIAILSPSQLPINPELQKWFFQKRMLKESPLMENKFDWDLPSRETAKILNGLGIEFVDITDLLRQKMREDPNNSYYALADTHWNENGNRAAAEIEGNLLKPLLCPR